MEKLCRTAYDNDVRIMIDAEDVCYQHHIDEVVMNMMEKYNKQKAIVFTTYQMYRWDRMDVFRKDLNRAREREFLPGH